jgi:hypothetical protein
MCEEIQNDFWDDKEHDYIKCKRCENEGCHRYDFYGISTGYWCDDCYEYNYPYRRDAYYDEGYAGEKLDD